jgi:hypothetical protein
MVKGKKHKESREHKIVEDFNTDRDIFKGHSFLFEEDKEFGNITRDIFTNELGENKHKSHPERLKQEEEFAKVFYTTNFKFQEDDEFDLLFNNISPKLDDEERFAKTFDFAKGTFANKFEEPACKFKQDLDIKVVKCPVLRGGCKQEEFDEFAQSWSRYAECQWEMDNRELRQQLMNCVVGPLELIMYNSLGSKLDTLSEPDLLEELKKLAVVKHIAEQQDVGAMVYMNNQAMVNMENTAKPTSLRSPAHGCLTQRSPVHSSTRVHSQSFPEEHANDKVLVVQVQEDLAAEDQALATEVQPVVAAEDQVLGKAVQLVVAAEDQAEQDEDRHVHPSKQEEDQTVHAESTAGNIIAHRGGGYLHGLQEKTQHH